MKLRMIGCEELLHLPLVHTDFHLPNDRDAVRPPIDPNELYEIGLNASRTLKRMTGAHEAVADVPLDQTGLESLVCPFCDNPVES